MKDIANTGQIKVNGMVFTSQEAADLYAQSRPPVKPKPVKSQPKPTWSEDKVLCRSCGRITTPTLPPKGHVLIMLLLFCFYLLPGVIYAIWRYTGLKSACAMCGSDNVIPSNSVVAQQIIADRDEAQLEVNCPFCKEKIKPDAIKCKHCGSALGATPTPS